MKLILFAFLMVLVPLAQVAIAPFFPIAGANFDFALVTLALLMVFAGPHVFMVALPTTALLLGFVSDHSPALLLVAYLPLLPLAAYVADLRVPLNRYAQTLLAGLATGMFARLLLSVAAVVQGADFGLSYTLGQILLPGAFLDFVFLTILYFPLRFVGWVPQSTSLQRGGY